MLKYNPKIPPTGLHASFYTGRAAWFSKAELMEVIRRGIPRQSAPEKEGA